MIESMIEWMSYKWMNKRIDQLINGERITRNHDQDRTSKVKVKFVQLVFLPVEETRDELSKTHSLSDTIR